jgi:transcriptional regulator with AAA-type ATPase domain/NAD-dependent dihydropyrimidine dehydrogenase PreA subunit
MTLQDVAIWLQERTALSILSEPALNAIAQNLEEKIVPANEILVVEDTEPVGLYILKQGRLEGDRTNQKGQVWGVSLLPGATIHLQELLLNQPAQRTIQSLSEIQLWFISAENFRAVVAQYPEINQAFSQQLAQELAQLSSQLNYQQERLAALRSYLVPKAKRGVIGKSRYAVRLRQKIRDAAQDRQSVLIFGEPGLEKDNLAALIHFGSPNRREPLIKINCGLLQTNGADLFGRVGGKTGLLEWLGDGTLLLNNIQEMPAELIPALIELLKTGTYQPVGDSQETSSKTTTLVQKNRAKIILISEKAMPEIERLVRHLIKVPPLRVRKADIAAQVDYYISLFCRAKSINRPKLSPEALRRLQAYDFPSNLRELQNLVERALVQSSGTKELTEELVWPSQTKKKQFRVNLLNAYPNLRHFLRSPWWPDRINYWIVLPLFNIVVAVLFLGPQNRAENFGLNLFWAWWWPLILLAFPFVGRLWCAFCPFMIYGEITQKLSQWLWPGQLKGWPRHEAEKWGGWFLFGLFTLIYLWEELWDLQNTAYLSACLLLLITAGAMIFSALFERRFWCRYLCPIGGMNGLFAKLSMIELRAQQGTCSAECTTYQCYKGGPQKGEGLETGGCPVYSHPAQLEDNRDCVLCMTCLKACPHRSVELNLRPPAIELWTTHVPRSYEVALLGLLLGGVFLHRLPEIQAFWGLPGDLSQFWPHLALSVAVITLPAAIPFLGDCFMKLSHRLFHTPKPRRFIELAYGYLPLVLGANLAHYLRLGLAEAGRIVPVSFATFGINAPGLPVWVAHPAVITFLQGTTLIVSVLLAMILTQKIARQPARALFGQHLAILGLGVAMWNLIVV